jgi:hypothetical protein
MAIKDSDETQIVQLLCQDVAATLGTGYEPDIRNHAVRIREFLDERDDYFDKVVEDVQQDFHDLFIHTEWPPCPFHVRHPLWHHDGFWVCEQLGIRVAPLGHLREGLDSPAARHAP